MKSKLFILILFYIVCLLAGCSLDTSQVTVNETEIIIDSALPTKNREVFNHSITAYLENEPLTITDTEKLLEITENCIAILPKSEMQAEPYKISIAKEEGLLIHIEYDNLKAFSVDASDYYEYPLELSGNRLYLAIGSSNWIGIQETGKATLSVLGFQSEENITDILSCLELSEQQKKYLLSMEPKITEPDFENAIIITAYSDGQEISVTDHSTLLYTAETCTDNDITFNTILYGDQLEELKSDELWINIYYNDGRNIYTPNSLCPVTIKNMYIIIGEQNSISLQDTNSNFHSLIGITNNEAIETLRSCVTSE